MDDTAAPHRPALRKDAARNRRRIMDAARELVRGGRPPQLNAVALAADVGVGTVYRHFPTPETLLEALAADRFAELIQQAHRAADLPDARQALRVFLKAVLTACVQDEAFAAAAFGPDAATPETGQLREHLQRATADLLARAAAVETLRPSLGPGDLLLLLCGLGFAVHRSPDRTDPTLPDRYLDALLAGTLIATAETTCDPPSYARPAAETGPDLAG
ncbi:TetR/AcrR family transcriptional regulator [Embleya sp. NPDC050154]|uniref:TetR/AcrR family transcriptional regulator n=1 Tax=unclassified Embleya TaxID=2699296 RepID=UPI00379E3E24